ncbi:MAG: TFIIB-type zinc ribbon-containing protein [Oscillospiraceae bacterium]|nr:TFIIB-type zinc ribbon-containing protein [Oscillospiraceae bacterium]
MIIKEKAAYLQGLLDGMKIDENSDQGKIFRAIADMINVVGDEVEEMQLQLDDLYDAVNDLEDEVEELQDDQDDDYYDYQLTCPNCGEDISAEDDDAEDMACPGCGAILEFGFDDDDDDFEDDDDEDDDDEEKK